MTEKNPVPAREDQEVWELTVPGRVHVAVTNHLGRPADVTAAGKGARIRLSCLDRQLAEEQVRTADLNPFRNGMLVQVAGARDGDESNALNDEQMLELFSLKPPQFEKVLEELSELNVRRLKVMTVPADATASQIRMIDAIIERKWPIGGATPTYVEMMAAPK